MTGIAQPRYDEAAVAAGWMLALNAGLCAAKLATGWFGGSFALLADGVNNLTDVGVSVALFTGLRLARRPADGEHAYGHGKIEQELARLVALGVLLTGGVIVVEAVRRLPVRHDRPQPLVLLVAAAAIAVKVFMYRYQNRRARQLGSRALQADALNHKSDVAATGCVLAGAGGVWLGGPQWSGLDDAAAIAVGVLMVVVAANAIYGVSSELLDRMPPPRIVQQVRALATSFPHIRGVDRVVGRRSGMGYFLDLHLEVDGAMTVREAHQLGHRVKDGLMTELPEISDIVVHLEPA